MVDLKRRFYGPLSAQLQEKPVPNPAAAFFITQSAINRSLFFRVQIDLALISGAGIAGLAAAFELRSQGFTVVIAEKRVTFDRFNVINLDVDTQHFLNKFGLLKEFEETVSARIKVHHTVLALKNDFQNLDYHDVSQLPPSKHPFEPEFFNALFNEDGVYSVKIKDLQTFLAKKALEAGVHILGNVEIDILERTPAGGVSEVRLTGKNGPYETTLQPHLFFIAEGAHSSTAKKLGIKTNEVINKCTGENWIFGNVKYAGKETFVVAMIDVSEKKLAIANIIFNAAIHEINIAVTSKRLLSAALIEKRILGMVQCVFSFLNIDEPPQSLTAVVKQPVTVRNETRSPYSIDNSFCIGDAAGHSSPLAGVGGTLGLTLVPQTVEKIVYTLVRQPHQTHHAFHIFTEGYTSRWIKKSAGIKEHCLRLFAQKRDDLSIKSELPPMLGGPK